MQHVENEFGDEELMDEEIKEYYEYYFQHQKDMLDDNCYDIQQDLQLNIVNPLAKNETAQHFSVEIHAPFPTFVEDIQI